MKRLAGVIVAMLFGLGVTLAAVLFLEWATLHLGQKPRSLEKAALALVLIPVGVFALLGALYLATQLAVQLWGKSAVANPDDVQSDTRKQP